MKKQQAIHLVDIKPLAKKIAAQLKGGEILGLIGNLGSGKTTFTKLLSKELKVKQKVTSPTFILMNLFPAKLINGKNIALYHLDLYRINSFKEVKALGIPEFWGRKNSVTVIEWADKIKKYLPKKTRYLFFV
jgi:tRNA threonylcarbamoyladenosine biosynthesis protein TsaE